jgi:acyl-CoA thioesterase I
MKFKAYPSFIVVIAAVFCLVGSYGPGFARTLSLVGLGDSLMAGYELPAEEAFPARLEKALRDKGLDVSLANAGVSGDTSADGLARLDWSVPDGTDGVILEFGANDALRGLSPEETEKNIAAMLESLKARSIPVLLVGILAPPNMGADYADRFNPIFSKLAAQYQVPLYPFFLDGVILEPKLKLADGMHPNAQGVGEMVNRFIPSATAFIETLLSH